MQVSDHLARAQAPLFSFEIVPSSIEKMGTRITEIELLQDYNPAWINVASHPQTKTSLPAFDLCEHIQKDYRIDAVAHVLCRGFTDEQTTEALTKLHTVGVHNVLALRGDRNFAQGQSSKNIYARDLVVDIKTKHPDFCVGVAGYPEKHVEAANFADDILRLKQKVDAGAQYVICQMFFDNQKYFSFVEQCRNAGVTVPILPGLRRVSSVAQLNHVTQNFHVEFPKELVDEIAASPKHVQEISMRWTLNQARELMQASVPAVHFYVFGDAAEIAEIVYKLQK